MHRTVEATGVCKICVSNPVCALSLFFFFPTIKQKQTFFLNGRFKKPVEFHFTYINRFTSEDDLFNQKFGFNSNNLRWQLFVRRMSVIKTTTTNTNISEENSPSNNNRSKKTTYSSSMAMISERPPRHLSRLGLLKK